MAIWNSRREVMIFLVVALQWSIWISLPPYGNLDSWSTCSWVMWALVAPVGSVSCQSLARVAHDATQWGRRELAGRRRAAAATIDPGCWLCQRPSAPASRPPWQQDAGHCSRAPAKRRQLLDYKSSAAVLRLYISLPKWNRYRRKAVSSVCSASFWNWVCFSILLPRILWSRSPSSMCMY